MLTQTNFNQASTSHILAANEETYSASSPLFARLAILAKQQKWIIFTDQVALPTVSELHMFHIEAKKVIKMKSSQVMSEKDVIMKVLSINNASAIVTGDEFSHQERQQIELQAQQTGCEVFFISQAIQQTLTRNMH
ncbi:MULTISPECIES: hypothetical protein [Vibrio]|uniref:Uncharacterized protein n=1 Tax=Vibrio algicola TaxID=2662262 RepID=A0A5Q0TEC0_9VIBR|nr:MULTISPECIES: hypothetical protein [Vibrio]MBD1575701.1 hypothetical protein [Vibrio sp. S11_S32]